MYEGLQQEPSRIIFDKCFYSFWKKRFFGFPETTLQLWLSSSASFDKLLAFWTCFVQLMAKEGLVGISLGPTEMKRKRHGTSSPSFPPPAGKVSYSSFPCFSISLSRLGDAVFPAK